MKKCWIAPLAAILLVAAVVLVSGCSSNEEPTPSDPTTGQAGDVDPAFTQAVDGFGFALLENLNEGATENTIISPVSIHDALSMTANGASGDTAAQMTELLGTFTYGTGNVNEQWANLIDTLTSDESTTTSSGEDKSVGTLDIANALWYQEGLVPAEDFLSTMQTYYGAQAESVEFGKDSATKTINDWASANTNGKITKIVDRDNLSNDTVMSLTNTVYYKADWATPFDKAHTKNENFTKADGSTVSVPMMNATESRAYFEDENAQVTKVPYTDGTTAMYVVLPKGAATTESVIDDLGGDGFATLKADMAKEGATEQVALSLPKLDTEYRTDLTSALKSMGMVDAFDQQAAEFPGIFSDTGMTAIYIGSVAHAVRLIVDENGTEAAAATAVSVGATSAPAGEPKVMKCDRPFVVVLANEDTGAVLFAGSILDPSK